MGGSGVGVSGQVGENAVTMIISCFLYFVMQIPAFYFMSVEGGSPREGEDESIYALFGLLCCLFAFVYYLNSQMTNDDNDAPHKEKAVDQRIEAIKSGDMNLRGVMQGIIDESLTSGGFANG